ncbi:GntR family transcriptional regulator [Vallitalea guaymasensis]|uniref:GntR family transcriptional regulator n=1 Tax=Vallitalea guaymasensis TaxID=1185412 RepID=UPI00272BD557|nr:GntR family transcriptional regulator [Vallitalea guaymasensis]
MINVEISNTSEKPIYQQLFEQISSQIIKGDLKNNYSLPPIRTAAKELRISIITVKKAWEALERQGFIYTITGRGCFVAELTAKEIEDKRDELTHKQMAKDIRYYKELGLSLSEITELVKKHY